MPRPRPPSHPHFLLLQLAVTVAAARLEGLLQAVAARLGLTSVPEVEVEAAAVAVTMTGEELGQTVAAAAAAGEAPRPYRSAAGPTREVAAVAAHPPRAAAEMMKGLEFPAPAALGEEGEGGNRHLEAVAVGVPPPATQSQRPGTLRRHWDLPAPMLDHCPKMPRKKRVRKAPGPETRVTVVAAGQSPEYGVARLSARRTGQIEPGAKRSHHAGRAQGLAAAEAAVEAHRR